MQLPIPEAPPPFSPAVGLYYGGGGAKYLKADGSDIPSQLPFFVMACLAMVYKKMHYIIYD